MEIHVPFFNRDKIIEYENIVEWNPIDIDEDIKTGDLLLFSSTGLLSSTIKAFTFSKWNHIGIACWCNLLMKDGSIKQDLFCYEMGSQEYEDLMTRTVVDKGVRLVRLANIAEMYDLIAVRKINRRFIKGDDSFINEFKNFMQKWKSLPFPNPLTLLKAYVFKPGYDNGQVTCAHLSALMLEHMKLIELNMDPSQLSPGHFSHESRTFPDDIYLDKETIIYRDTRWLEKRQLFIFVIVIVLIIILILIHVYYKSNKKFKNKL